VVAEVGREVHVRDFTDTEATDHALVLLNLVSLETIDRVLAMEDGNELHQLSVVVNLLSLRVDSSLDCQLGGFLAALALEEVLHRGLSLVKLGQLGFIVSFLSFQSHHDAHDLIASLERI